MKIRKAIIPVAGLGIRFLPVTKAIPKEMLPIIDKPAIQYIVEEAFDSGIEEILIISSRAKKGLIEDHFDKYPYLENYLKQKGKDDLLEILNKTNKLSKIYSLRQKEPLGLGHAVYCAKGFVEKEPFAVLLGDDLIYSQIPALKQLMEVYQRTNSSVLGIKEVLLEDVSKYGILDAKLEGNLFKVNDLVEKPMPKESPSTLAIVGRYIITPAIFDILEKVEPDLNGEIQLTNALKVLCQKEAMYGVVFEGKRYDVGDKLGYLKATVEFALAREDLGEEFLAYLKKLI